MTVTLYTTPSCSYCKMEKAWLLERGVPFVEHNIASDLAKAEELARKTGQMGVPVTEIDGRLVLGFDQRALERALARR